MKTRAAVAFEKAKPLEIADVELEGPKAGEVLVEIKATGICHTDEFTLSGADPEGLFPAILGHEGAGVVVEVGPGVTSRQEGRPRHSALHAGMPAMPVVPVAQDQSVHRHPRDAGPGRDAGRHVALLARRPEAPPLHGHLDLRRTSPCCRRSRSQRSARTRRSTRSATSAAASPPASARCSTRRRSSPAPTAIVFGLGGIGLNVIQGLRLAGADMIIGVDLNNCQEGVGRALRHDPLRQSEGGRRRPRAHLVNMTKSGADQIGGADYTFDCTGNVTVMRQALEACHRGWGESIIIGVAAAGAGDRDAAVPARHRPGLERHRLRRRARPHRRAEDRRLVHGRQDRDRPDDHPHACRSPTSTRPST